ncbi:hypothetical protein CRG98_010496 [Punica granatum]|uniref:Uncharacterized protein n=1 Tax=Punica granatum TaxID=22663 RepID=A0A2I0KKH6_PUNGR|nr:hypothetical protein CRG98_010496 [Punica granatum]
MGCRAWGTLNFESPVIATLEGLDCDWRPHSCTFLGCGLACAAVLGKARGAGSHEDRWRHARTTRKDALDYTGGCARLHEGTCAWSFNDAWLRGVSEKVALLRKVDRSSGHGSPCRGERTKVAPFGDDPSVGEVDHGGRFEENGALEDVSSASY